MKKGWAVFLTSGFAALPRNAGKKIKVDVRSLLARLRTFASG
jgi:hypothetical protein